MEVFWFLGRKKSLNALFDSAADAGYDVPGHTADGQYPRFDASSQPNNRRRNRYFRLPDTGLCICTSWQQQAILLFLIHMEFPLEPL